MRLACVGDVGVDNYTNLGLLKPGGIAFNVAVNALACGLDVSLVSALGTDRCGDAMRSLISNLDLNPTHLRRFHGATARQDIFVELDGERRFVGYDKGVLTQWHLTPSDTTFIATHDAIFVPLSDGMETIFHAVTHTPGPALKAADFSIDYELADYDNPDNLLTRHSAVFDIVFFGGRHHHLPMMESLATYHPDKLFVLTLGAAGAIALQHNTRHHQPATPVPHPVDTTGCGDAFQAAFLASYLQTRDIPTALTAAANRAAIIIAHLGSTTFELTY
jgi:fructoselysine 6-kinase